MSNIWTLVLAGGDGTRLAPITRRNDGEVVPKQFCRFTGKRSLLEQTLDRAERLSGRSRTVTVVTAKHARWWSDQLGDRARDHIVVQEQNRGTAAGVLLPIAHIVKRDPNARIVILPSDHHFADEDAFVRSIQRGVEASQHHPEHVLLLGIVPDSPESDYGWIVPAGPCQDGPAAVARFVEKPPRHEALQLMAEGGLWSSFVLVGRASTLRDMFVLAAPHLVAMVDNRVGEERCSAHYVNGDMPELDFSRDILQVAPQRLRVMAVASSGWSDIGTPERLQECLRSRPVTVSSGAHAALAGFGTQT